MNSFQLVLFAALWICLMAIPVKLGLLPGLTATLEATGCKFWRLIAMLTSHFLPRDVRDRVLQDLEFSRLLDRILRNLADPRWVPRAEIDGDPGLTRTAYLKIKPLIRNARIVHLGSYAGDVITTFNRVIALVLSEQTEDALKEMYALRGRISVTHCNIDLWNNALGFPLFDEPIFEIAGGLKCGLDRHVLRPLDRLTENDPASRSHALTEVSAICSDWIDEHGIRAAQFASYVERLSVKFTKDF
jgi:hypothetical protein